MRWTRHVLRVTLALAALASGCGHVKPWEREDLAHPAMAERTQPAAEAFDAHVAAARESALQPSSSGGGGCGCN